MILHGLSPYIRVAMDNVVDGPWIIRERQLFDYELLYVMEGSVEVTIEGQLYEGRRGDIFLFRPRQRHTIKKTGEQKLRQPHLHFDFHYQENSSKVKVSFKTIEHISGEEAKWFRHDIIDEMPVSLSSHLRLQKPIIIEKMLMDIINEYDMKMPFFEIKMKGLFIQLWIQLLRENYWNQNSHVGSNFQTLMRIKEYLKLNFERKVSLDEISKFSGISKHYLVRLFKKAFGMSPIQYHQLIRIEKAREMIQLTNESLTVIAEKVGYPNIHSFSRIFKKTDGVNPSFYKRIN